MAYPPVSPKINSYFILTFVSVSKAEAEHQDEVTQSIYDVILEKKKTP